MSVSERRKKVEGYKRGYHRVSRKIPITYLYRCLGGYDISRFKKFFFKLIQLKFEIFQKCYGLQSSSYCSIVSDTHQKMTWCYTSNVEADELNRLGSDLNFKLVMGRTLFEVWCLRPKIGCSSSITKRWIRSSPFDVWKNDVWVCLMSSSVNLGKAF